jgi:hypothetical protein
VLGGSDNISFRVPVTSVIAHEAFKNYFFHGQFQPHMVCIQTNATASKWVDLISLVQSQDIDVTDEAGDVVSDGFLSAVTKYSTAETPISAAWRWQMVAADNNAGLILQLQSLPASADSLLAQPIFRFIFFLFCHGNHAIYTLSKKSKINFFL